jgi:hypothetical protein
MRRETLVTLNVFLIAVAWAFPGTVRAYSVPATEPTRIGAPGGATQVSATPLYSERLYKGTIRKKGQQIWYQFRAGYNERALFELSGRARRCPVRATLLDGAGNILAQIISSASEVEPFLVLLPARAGLNLYLLRLEGDSNVSCSRGSFSLTMIEPYSLEPVPMSSPIGPSEPSPPPSAPTPPRESLAGYGAAPALPSRSSSSGVLAEKTEISSRFSNESARCNRAGLAYRKAKDEAEQASRQHRGSTRTRQEDRKRAAYREMLKYCPGVT